MARTRVQDGNNLTLTHANLAGRTSGQPVVVGQLSGIMLNNASAANRGTFATEGVHRVSVRGHNGTANTAVAVGGTLTYVHGAAFLDLNPGNVLFGYALEPVVSGATTTIEVLLAKK